MGGFRFDVVRVDIHLHVERAFNACTAGLERVLFMQEVPVERRNVAEPGVMQRLPVDQVQMGVEDHGALP